MKTNNIEMETEAIGGYDSTFRGNKWIALVLSMILPGIGHLYLANHHDDKRNFNRGISLITISIAYIIMLSYGDFASAYLCAGYIGIIIYSACDAYHSGRSYSMWSGVVM